jgi:hypothetical protein
MQVYIPYYRPVSTDFVIFLGLFVLFVDGSIGRSIGGLGDYLVFSVQPCTQI